VTADEQLPIGDLIQMATDVGVRLQGVIPGPGGSLPGGAAFLYRLPPPGHDDYRIAHALIDELGAREPEVMEALVADTVGRWDALGWRPDEL